jgi:putative ABC transport system permease protein
MTFVLRMVARETRASWRRLIFFFLCVAIGVGAMAAVRSVIQNVRGALAREARALTAADLVLQSNRPWDENARAIIDRHLAAVGGTATTDLVETATMVRPEDMSKAVAKMVELQAVERPYPFYGRVVLEGGAPYRHDILRDRGALVRPELLAQLGLVTGDRIVIGNETFTIRGVIVAEPGRRTGFFTFGPRVLIDAADLPGTGLIGFGSRARYQRLVRIDDAARLDGLTRDLRIAFSNTLVTVRSYRNNEDRVGEQLQVAENYLGLVGYVMVVLGGIGVWSVTRVFIQQKLQSIAVLKCVGATVAQVLGVYVVQVLLLGAAGSLMGLALGALMLLAAPTNAFAALGAISVGLTPSASLQAFGIGVLVSLLFALVPLLEVRRVRPLLLLREETSAPVPAPPPAASSGAAVAGVADSESGSNVQSQAQSQPRMGRVRRAISTLTLGLDPLQWLAGGSVVAVLVLLASWQAASWRVGGIVSIGFVLTAIALHLVGLAVVRAVRPLGRVQWFPMRHAVNGLGRPGHQTRVILLAVGLGVFFILGVRLLQMNLTREFSVALQPDAPDMFLIDVQQDQADALKTVLSSVKSDSSPRLLPVLRARVTGVQGKELNLASVESVRERGNIGREFTVTYRDHLQPNETIVAGTFWTSLRMDEKGVLQIPWTKEDATDPVRKEGFAPPEVSIERGLRDRVGIQLGDIIRFDILGRPIEATVTSIREVNWSDSRNGGFVFVFRPDVLERAPHGFVATLKGPADQSARARLQRDVVARFPNVSVIDLRDVLRTVEGVLSNVTFGISVVGGVALASGLLILIGAVAMTKFQRLRDVALLKTLGASSRVIAALLVIEYGLLGIVAGAVGAVGASILSWVVSTRVLDIQWRLEPLTLAAAILLTAAIVGIAGVLSSVDVLRRKPLAVLRTG